MTSLNEYDGTGDFFKIAYHGPKDATTWSVQNGRAINFTIPRTTPPGLYLMRVEQFLPHSQLDQSQFYVNCAHINVIGPGGGKLCIN